MSPPLPLEILDLIVDNLHTEPTTLKACCLISKSWVPWIRRRLFAFVRFNSNFAIESWQEHFPDPSNSPAYHTRTLDIDVNQAIAAAEIDAPAWIYPFRHLVDFRLRNVISANDQAALRQFHGLSPTLRSLSLRNVFALISEILQFICSFPLLENLTYRDNHESNDDGWHPPRTSPRLTGALYLGSRNRAITRGLLRLPGGLHFTQITVWQRLDDAESIKELVSKCSGTMEDLCINFFLSFPHRSTVLPPIDISKCSKLKRMKFGVGYDMIRWVITALQAPKPKSLQQITIYAYRVPYHMNRETAEEWLEIDRLLAELWTSHSIVPRITSTNADSLRTLAPRLLPELTGRGVVCEDECER